MATNKNVDGVYVVHTPLGSATACFSKGLRFKTLRLDPDEWEEFKQGVDEIFRKADIKDPSHD